MRSNSPSLLLFTRWDRFSRNTGDAYYMIKTLKNLGVDAQAIEQPLDLTIPENKMMLAFYLAIPEVENDRKGLNVKKGMLKAKEEGRWLGPAPIGYVNQHSTTGLKHIVQKEPEASMIKFAFEQLSSGKLSLSEVHRLVFRHGLKCSRSNFSNLVRNCIYAGLIRISGPNKISHTVPGQHLGIVSLDLF